MDSDVRDEFEDHAAATRTTLADDEMQTVAGGGSVWPTADADADDSDSDSDDADQDADADDAGL